ncbi:hypothetical protein TSOC_014295, partial [Tetrabaena socialis]
MSVSSATSDGAEGRREASEARQRRMSARRGGGRSGEVLAEACGACMAFVAFGVHSLTVVGPHSVPVLAAVLVLASASGGLEEDKVTQEGALTWELLRLSAAAVGHGLSSNRRRRHHLSGSKPCRRRRHSSSSNVRCRCLGCRHRGLREVGQAARNVQRGHQRQGLRPRQPLRPAPARISPHLVECRPHICPRHHPRLRLRLRLRFRLPGKADGGRPKQPRRAGSVARTRLRLRLKLRMGRPRGPHPRAAIQQPGGEAHSTRKHGCSPDSAANDGGARGLLGGSSAVSAWNEVLLKKARVMVLERSSTVLASAWVTCGGGRG